MLTQAAAALLEAMAQRPAPTSENITARSYRAFLSALPKFADPAVADIDTRDLDGGPVPIRQYRPVGAATKLPATIFFHGGGYVACGIASHDDLCRKLAALSGTAIFSVEYRLAPEHVFPAAVDDAYAAAVWVHANAGALDIDPARLAVAGDSAGGALAIVTALRFRDEGNPGTIIHQLLMYPSTDLLAIGGSRQEFATGYGLDENLSQWFLSQYVPATTDRADWRLSPGRADPTGLPSATIITAGCDPLRDEAEHFGKRLCEAGTTAETRRFDGTIHGFMSMYRMLPEGEQAIRYAADRLRSAFAIA